MADHPPPALQNALRHRYTIRHELGRGGTAFVFLAHDLKHDRAVAIKVLRPEIAMALGAERFLREIRLAARLQHPHILPLYDSGEAAGLLYYVMPPMEGQSLRQRLAQEGRLPLEEALRITAEVCDALGYAHSQDIVHRDIKPENILLTRGHALVADFGIARAISVAAGDPIPDRTDAAHQGVTEPTGEKVTDTGIAVGTPAYMSPEQAEASRMVDGRSDLYSLGCVLYEMLGGEPPFTGPSGEAVRERHAREPVPPLRTGRQTLPPHVEQTLSRVLAKAPADRFTTARDFADALAAPSVARPRQARLLGATAAGLILLAAAWWGVKAGGGPSGPINRLAVLPLENLTGDTTQEYFVDGMHDALVTELARIGALSVISRTSVLGYRNTTKPVPEIARELGVDALVEGSVALAGDSVRVTAQLISGPTDRHLWAGTYVRDRRHVLHLYSDVTRAIAREVRVALTPAEQAHLTNRRPVDPVANDLHLKGGYYCSKWTEQDMTRGIGYFRRAIDQDPTFAPAYAGLAGCYADFALFSFGAHAEYLPRARVVVQRALELDSTLGDAHAALGWIRFVGDLDFDGPDSDFLRALELSPGSAVIHLTYSDYLVLAGRPDEALVHSRRAIELDPLSATTSLNLGWVYFKARRYDESIAQLERTLELESDYWWAHAELGWAYSQKGMHEAAVSHCDSAAAGAREVGVKVVSGCGWVYGRAGRRQEAMQVLRQVTAQPALLRDPLEVSTVYVGLGDHDRALEWLRKGARERWPSMTFLKVEPMLDPLRSDPRFQALLRDLGIGF